MDEHHLNTKEQQMRIWVIVLSLAVTFGTMGSFQEVVAAAPPSAPAKGVVAQVNGKTITYQELNNEFRARTRRPFERVQADPQWKNIRKQILEQIINEELLWMEAERQKLPVAQEAIDTRFKKLHARFPSTEVFNQELKARGLTAEQVKKDLRKGLMRQQIINKEVFDKVSVSPRESEFFFQGHKDTYVKGEAVHARHILIKVASDASPEDDRKAKKRAKAVLAKAKKGEDFAQLAKQYSEGPSKTREGDLGYLGRGKTVKPFEDAAFKLKVGEISDLVRTQFGYHIIKVEDRQEAKQLSYQEAEDRVKADLTKQKATARYQKFIEGLRKKAKITINLK
ncbi:MAG: peptidylprolyl isomerase [candidate division NC10 bacterium]